MFLPHGKRLRLIQEAPLDGAATKVSFWVDNLPPPPLPSLNHLADRRKGSGWKSRAVPPL
jgi:hypothetical protein